jgi:hypothetical protein
MSQFPIANQHRADAPFGVQHLHDRANSALAGSGCTAYFDSISARSIAAILLNEARNFGEILASPANGQAEKTLYLAARENAHGDATLSRLFRLRNNTGKLHIRGLSLRRQHPVRTGRSDAFWAAPSTLLFLMP